LVRAVGGTKSRAAVLCELPSMYASAGDVPADDQNGVDVDGSKPPAPYCASVKT
jgi:hypothetical protein